MISFHAAILSLAFLLLPLISHAHDVFYPTGTYYHGETDLRVAVRGVPMVWERTYRCNRIVNGDTYIASDGRTFTFDKDDSGALKPDFANGYTLTATGSSYQLQEICGNTSTFDNSGRLLTITDSQGRTATLGYNGSQFATIKGSTGRTVYNLIWSGDHIGSVSARFIRAYSRINAVVMNIRMVLLN